MVRFRIKEIARAKGLTSEELAYRSGVSVGTVRNLWQNRASDAMYTTLSSLAQALEVRIEDLIEEVKETEGTEERTQKNTAPEQEEQLAAA